MNTSRTFVSAQRVLCASIQQWTELAKISALVGFTGEETQVDDKIDLVMYRNLHSCNNALEKGTERSEQGGSE